MRLFTITLTGRTFREYQHVHVGGIPLTLEGKTVAAILDPTTPKIRLLAEASGPPFIMVAFRIIDDTITRRYRDIDDNSANYFYETRRMCSGGPGQVLETIPATSQVLAGLGSLFIIRFPVEHTVFGHPGLAVNADEVISLHFVIPIERFGVPIDTIDACFDVGVDPEVTAVHTG